MTKTPFSFYMTEESFTQLVEEIKRMNPEIKDIYYDSYGTPSYWCIEWTHTQDASNYDCFLDLFVVVCEGYSELMDKLVN